MAQDSNIDRIKEFQKTQKLRLVGQYIQKAEESTGTAKLITKAEFDEQYPEKSFERYSLQSVNKFREELMKAEGVDNPEDAFIKATKDLKHFVVQSEGNKAILFVRKKEAGE